MKKVAEVIVNGLTIKDIQVRETSGYNGFEIFFTYQSKLYKFMVAKTEPFLPLNVIHLFKEEGICPLCRIKVFPHPIGNQPCSELKKIDRLILEKIEPFI